MLNLVQNENMKIYRRIRTWILVGILIGLTATVSIIAHSFGNSDKDWRTHTQQNIEANKHALSQNGVPGMAKEEMERRIQVDQYRLDHDIAPADNTLWGNVVNMANLVQIVTIFTVVIAADSVAGEFAGGTIKLLLIRPASRSKILLSKYISTVIFSLLLLVVLFLTSFILGGILYGFSDVGLPYVYAGKDLVVHESSMIGHAISTYGLKCIELVMIVTLAFMISTVFRSSSLAIGLSLGFLFLGQMITLILTRWNWGKYWLFANTDLTQYTEGKPLIEGMTMGFSIGVLIVYFVLFNVLSWSIFNKRDVAA